MSISAATNFTAATNSANSEVQFDQKLTIAKSSQILVDYMNKTGKGTIHGNDLKNLANNTSGNVPQDVMAAASFMTRHQDVFTAIETHDVATVDNFSGVWNLEWAANGGLNGTSLDAITNMTETFDRAIAKSAEITELTTEAKTELDSTKQRPQN